MEKKEERRKERNNMLERKMGEGEGRRWRSGGRRKGEMEESRRA